MRFDLRLFTLLYSSDMKLAVVRVTAVLLVTISIAITANVVLLLRALFLIKVTVRFAL